MTDEELKKLAQKVSSNQASKEEKLTVLQEMNKLVKEVRVDLAKINKNN